MKKQKNVIATLFAVTFAFLGMVTVHAGDNKSPNEISLEKEDLLLLKRVFETYALSIENSAPALSDISGNDKPKKMLGLLKNQGIIPGSLLNAHTDHFDPELVMKKPDDYFIVWLADLQLLLKRSLQKYDLSSDGSLIMNKVVSDTTPQVFERWKDIRVNFQIGDGAEIVERSLDGYCITAKKEKGHCRAVFFRRNVPVDISDPIRLANEGDGETRLGLKGFMNKFESYGENVDRLGGHQTVIAQYLFQTFVLNKAVPKMDVQRDLIEQDWIGAFVEKWESPVNLQKFAFIGTDKGGKIVGSDIFSLWEIDSRGQNLVISPGGKIYLPRFSEDQKRMVMDVDGEIFIAFSVYNKDAGNLISN